MSEILHHAEEYGQSRQYARQEAIGLFVLAVLVGLWTGLSVMVVGAAYFLYTEHGFWIAFFSLAIPVGVLAGSGWVIVKGAPEQLDGLRSYRQATTYAPPIPEPEPVPEPPPILVHQPGKEPYILDRQGLLPAPDGRESNLILDETTILAILGELITKHGGKWSRERVMAIKVGGERVTRPLFEELRDKLEAAGFLQGRSQGGHEFPADVQQPDDLTRYFPNMRTRTVGGTAGRLEAQGEKTPDGQPADGEGGAPQETLAERRKARWLACNRDIEAYLERDGDGP